MTNEQHAALKPLVAAYTDVEKRYEAEFIKLRRNHTEAGTVPPLRNVNVNELADWAGRYCSSNAEARARLLHPSLRTLAAELVAARVKVEAVYADISNDELDESTTWRARANAARTYASACTRICYLEQLATILASSATNQTPTVFERMVDQPIRGAHVHPDRPILETPPSLR